MKTFHSTVLLPDTIFPHKSILLISHRISLKKNIHTDSTAVQVTTIPTSLQTNHTTTAGMHLQTLGTGRQRSWEHLNTRVSHASVTTIKSQVGYEHWMSTLTLQLRQTTITQNSKCSSGPVRACRAFAAHASVSLTKSG